jgi:hypothetical protein
MKNKTRLLLASSVIATAFSVVSAHAQAGRQATGIAIRDDSRITLATSHPSGITDTASTARQNILDTAACKAAKTSAYSDVGVTSVWLHTGMLTCMNNLAKTYGYTYRVTEIAGGDHSSTSYHYRGTAFDVGTINGSGVSSSNPYWSTFNQRCRNAGSIESLGPGNAGHSTHVHNAWTSGTSASAAGGCLPASTTVTVDNSSGGFSVVGSWATSTGSTDKYGADYRYKSTAPVSEPATWTASLPSSGTYTVSAWWSAGANRSATAPYIVYHSSGTTTVNKNQQGGGGAWSSLGNFSLAAGSNQVKLSCWTSTGFVVIADAIRWTK